MSRESKKKIAFGVMKGLNERFDARAIDDNELVKADNVYNRGGKICPRPGYAELHSDSVALAYKRIRYNGNSAISFIAVDSTNGAIYWTERTTGRIRKVLFSTGVVSDVVTSLTAPTGIALDVANDLIYFADDTAIKHCTLAGGSVTTLYSSEGGAVGGLAIDLTNSTRLLYWATTGVGIRKGDSGGGTRATRVDIANSNTLTLASGVAVAPSIDKVYWSRNGSSISQIKRATASVNDTAVEAIISVGGGWVPGIAVDESNNKIFTSTVANNIRRYDLDGSNGETWMSAQSDIVTTYGFAIDTINDRLYAANVTSGLAYTIYSISSDTSTSSPVSTHWFNRSILGVDSTMYFCSDLVFAQSADVTQGKTELSILFPSLSTQKSIQMGYSSGSGTAGHPTIWSTDNRDTDPTYFDPFSNSSARCSFAYRGKGIDTGAGGWLVAQDGIAPRNINYVLSDTIWTFDFAAGSTGTWQLVMNGYSTSQTLTHVAPTVGELRANLLTHPQINGCHVSRTGSGPYTYTVRIHGVWSGQNTPTLSSNKSSGADMTIDNFQRSQTGGLDTNAWLYCRPCGVPTPVTGTTTDYPFSADTTATGTALDIGYYSFIVTFYSSRWNIESPPSAPFGDLTSPYVLITTAGTDERAIINITSYPSTIYFDNTTVPFRHVDWVYVYARRWGTALSGGVPDGVGAWDNWYRVVEQDIGQSTASSGTPKTIIWDGDPADNTGIPVPVENGYPPDDAKLAIIHKNRAFYPATDHNIWYSNLDNERGESGHEYVTVGTNSYIEIAEFTNSDYGFTSGFSYADRLIISDPNTVFALETSGIDDGNVFSERIRGSSGIANHWMVQETEAMPDLAGYMLWTSPNGHVFLFDGGSTKRISSRLRESIDDIHRKFWVDSDYFETGLATSYYGSSVLWPDENIVILSLFDKSGTAYNLVYNIETDAWTKWNVGGFGWCLGRQWTGTDKGKNLLVFGKAGGKLYKLGEGYDDDGSSFSTDIRSKRFAMGSPFHKKLGFEAGAMFNVRQQSSSQTTDPTVAVTAIIPSVTTTSWSTTLTDAEVAVAPLEGPARTVQVKVTETISGSDGTRTQKVSELDGFCIDHGMETGMMRENKDGPQ